MEITLDTGDPFSRTASLATLLDAASTDTFLYSGLASVLVLLLAFSAVLSGAEVAFFSLSPEERGRCREGDARDRTIATLLDNPRQLLATMLVGNHLCNFAFILLSVYTAWWLGHWTEVPGIFLALLLYGLTFVIVFLGELIPKVYARQQSWRFARRTAYFVGFLSRLFRPLSWVLIQMTRLIEEEAHRRGYWAASHRISVEELNHVLEVTTGEDTTAEEKEILRGIVNFGNLSARQVMRSRVDITAFDVSIDFHELMDKINKFGYSRVPVYRDTIDKLEGILYIKDLLPFLDQNEHFSWQQLLRPGYFIPENKKIDDLLADFQEKRVHMAIVVDEYGGTSGLITLEDIIEEIVGEINDEFDDDDPSYSQLDEYTYLFEGKISLHDFCKVLEVDSSAFEDVKGDSESLGGLLLELFAKLPRSGEQVSYGDFTFIAVAVDAKKIKKVKVKVGQSARSATS